jgi:type VI secretion system secreted protein Hcp
MNIVARRSVAAAVLLALPMATLPAVDMFLKLESIESESTDETHSKEIDVLAWSWGGSRSRSASMGAGASRSVPCIQDLSMTKWIDKSSPKLVGNLIGNAPIKSGKLTVRKAGETPVEYYTIEMTNIFVTSLSTGGSGGEDRLTENVSLDFQSATIKYVPQDFTGKAGSPIPVTISASSC